MGDSYYLKLCLHAWLLRESVPCFVFLASLERVTAMDINWSITEKKLKVLRGQYFARFVHHEVAHYNVTVVLPFVVSPC